MKILISGGTGFLGSCVVRFALETRCNVTVISRNPNSSFRLSDLRNDIQFIDYKQILAMNAKLDYDIIINCATSYGRNNETISDVITVNTLLPIKLFEAMKDGALFINCDTFYNKNNCLYTPVLHYSMSKMQTRQWLMKVSEEKNKRIVNLIFEHIYGPNDSNHKFIPFLIKSMMDSVPELDLTSCTIKRDFIYVDDAAKAILSIIENISRISDTWTELQVGTGKSMLLKEMVITIRDIIGYTGNICFGKRPERNGEIDESYANLIGWNNLSIDWSFKTNLKYGLHETIKSYE